MAVPNTFATKTGTILLSDLDTNFATPITIGATSIALGSTATSINGLNNLSYTGTLTGGTGVLNIGAGQIYKDASGNVGLGVSSPQAKLDIAYDSNSLPALKISGAWASAARSAIQLTNTDTAITNIANISFSSGAVATGTVGVSGTEYTVVTATSGKIGISSLTGNGAFISAASNPIFFYTGTAPTERMRVDNTGNTFIQTGNFWKYSPAPTALVAGANAVTAVQLKGEIFTVAAAITTAVTMTLPTGTAIDTEFPDVPSVNIGFDFFVQNNGTTAGAVTVALNGNTNGGVAGNLTVAINTSAYFRLRRTAANAYTLYRLG